MNWPKQLKEILKSYFDKQSENHDILSVEDKEALVCEMQIAYNKLTEYEKQDVLVPAKARYLKGKAIKKENTADKKLTYSILYEWPKESFASPQEKFTFTSKTFFDRIGSNDGKYLSPLNDNGSPQSLYSRAIPYYIPEKDFTTSPAYHRYVVLNKYESKPDDNFLFGSVAPAFDSTDLDRLGTQISLDTKTVAEVEGRILKEIIKGRKKWNKE